MISRAASVMKAVNDSKRQLEELQHHIARWNRVANYYIYLAPYKCECGLYLGPYKCVQTIAAKKKNHQRNDKNVFECN